MNINKKILIPFSKINKRQKLQQKERQINKIRVLKFKIDERNKIKFYGIEIIIYIETWILLIGDIDFGIFIKGATFVIRRRGAYLSRIMRTKINVFCGYYGVPLMAHTIGEI